MNRTDSDLVLDPWAIDIRRIDLTQFTTSTGVDIDPTKPFAVNSAFTEGIYCYGPRLREHAYGTVFLALEMRRALVVEVDQLSVVKHAHAEELTGPESQLMRELGLVSELRHRHLPEMLGAGIANREPFVVRPYRMGKPLSLVLSRGIKIEPGFAFGLLYAVADTLDFLSRSGPQEGSCSMGGFTPDDVYLGYGGGIYLTGAGYKSMRASSEDSPDQDLNACLALARRLDPEEEIGMRALFAAAKTIADVAKIARKTHAEACAVASEAVSAMFRNHFPDDIRLDRAFFGLQTLQ